MLDLLVGVAFKSDHILSSLELLRFLGENFQTNVHFLFQFLSSHQKVVTKSELPRNPGYGADAQMFIPFHKWK